MRTALRRAAACAGGGLVVLAAPQVASAATVSVWHMDEPSSATRMLDSVGRNNGSLANVTPGLAGVTGLAYSFNGSSSVVTISGSSGLNPGGRAFAFTVHAKFPAPPSAAVGDYDLLRKGLSSETGGFYKMEIAPGGRASCWMGNPDVGQSGSITAGPDLSDNQWHEITCVRQGSRLSVVVDGTTFSNTVNTGTISNGAAVTVGAKVTAGIADQYGGLMDEVSFSTEGAASVSPPTITGAATVGSTLQASTGGWNAAPVPAPTFAYQWQRCAGSRCTRIAGATGATYAAQSADVGAALRVAVTATSLGKAATALSVQTAAVQRGPAPAPDPPAPTAGGGGAPTAPGAAPVPQGQVVGACQPIVTKWIRRSVRLRRGGRSTLRFDIARRTAALHARRGAIRTVRFTIDGRALRLHRDRRHAVVRASALTPGAHLLRAIVRPRRGVARTLAVRLLVTRC
jgi:Concanavalin A-like lectin/glucanases superfamily/Ig domain of plant-specific actin-binding protein